MAKILPVTNGMQGSTARIQINEALQSVTADSSLGGDGNAATPLSVQEAPWGGITGTLSDQIDLQDQLDKKQTLINTRKVVNTKSDFPTPSSGVITLADNTEYFVGAAVDLGTDRIVFGSNSTIDGNSSTYARLTYTGTGVMFTAVDNDLELRNIGCTCASGTLLSATDMAGNEGTSEVSIRDLTVFAAAKLGTLTEINSFIIQGANFTANDGFNFIGSNFAGIAGHFFIAKITSGTGIVIDLGTSVSSTILFNDQQVILPSGSAFLKGAAASANLAVGGFGIVSFTSQLGVGDSLVGIDVKDERWTFSGNSHIENTNRDRLNNQVVVNKLEDFPTPIAGVITLEANTDYVIGDTNVDVGTNRFALNSNVVITGSPGPSKITSTHSGDLFSGGDLNLFNIRGCTIDAPNADIFNIVDTVPGTTIILSGNRIERCSSLGIIQDVFGVNFETNSILEADTGITLVGINNIVSLRQLVILSTSATFKGIDFGTSVSSTIEIVDLLCIAPVGALGISGLVDSGNVAIGSVANVNNSEFQGGMTALENITSDDIRWNFLGNSGISDSSPDSLIVLTNNVAETVITATSTDGSASVLVSGSWSLIRESQFSSTAGGRVTSLGERDIALPVTIQVTLESASGNNKTVAVYLAVNGVAIPEARGIAKVSANDPRTINIPWQINFSENDYVEIFVENQTDTVNLIVSDAIVRVR